MKNWLSWGAISVIVPTLLFAGIGVLALGNVSAEDYIIAKTCFLLICLIFALKVVEWGSERGTIMSYLVVSLVCAALGSAALWGVRYVDRKRASALPKESTQASSTEGKEEPTTNDILVNKTVEPIFPNDVRIVRTTTRGRHFTDSIDYLEKFEGRTVDEKVTGGFPIRIRVEDRKPYIDAKVYTESGFIEIRNNKLVEKPKGWDENSNDRAIEIVNEKQQPIFQLMLMSSEHIDIEGWFSKNIAESTRFDRIFNYPSSEHRGELVEPLKLLSLTDKSLYTLFLEGCPGKSTSHGTYRLKGEEREFQIEVMECADLDTRAFYLNTFIPAPLDSEPVIRQLVIEYKEIIRRYANSSGFLRLRPGERPERSDGLTFTGLINIYHEGILDQKQTHDLEQEFIKQGATTVRFYDEDYVITRNSPLYPK